MTTDEELDRLYDSIDKMMREGRFDEIDTKLEAISITDCSVDFLLGILTATLPGNTHLKCRGQFFDDVKTTLIDRKEYEDGLLTGLEVKTTTVDKAIFGEWFCANCCRVWQQKTDSPECCGKRAKQFDLAAHGRRLVPSANAWAAVYGKWKNHPLFEEARKQVIDGGNYGLPSIFNRFVSLLEDGQNED